MNMEAKKSQDLQWASWGPRRADGGNSSLKASQLENQKELMFHFEIGKKAGLG